MRVITTSIERSRAAAGQAGFTLLELMIAVAITGILFTGFFSIIRTAMDTQLLVREFSDADRTGPAILEQISEDLRNAYFYNLENNNCFEGKKVEHNGEARIDQFHFLTTRTSLAQDEAIPSNEEKEIGLGSPVTEVSYMLREGQDGYYELCRRESPFVDEEPFKGGYFRLICDRILSFKVQYTGWDFGATDENSPFGDQAGENNDERNSNGTTGGNDNGDTADNGDENSEDDDESGELVWEDDWSARDRASIPVAVKIELVVAPDIDPDVMRRMNVDQRDAELEKSYLHIILLPQFREDPEATRDTYNWPGTVAEPGQTGGVAGGAVGGRGAPGAAGAAGGRGGRGGANGRGNRSGGTRGQPRALPIGGRGGGNGGGSNRLAEILRGNR